MFHVALYTSQCQGDEAIASILAQRKLEEIRGWAYERTSGGHNFFSGDWSRFHNKEWTDSSYSKFLVRAWNEVSPVAMPFRGFHGPARTLTRSARVVKVEVSWTAASLPRVVRFVTLIGEPRPDSARVVVAPAGDIMLGPFESVQFTARCEDADGQEIPNVPFHWHVAPMTANGTVSTVPNQLNTAVFTNMVRRLDGAVIATEGLCKVCAVARVAGEEVPGYSSAMRLRRF
jgi:hypothetical protein